MRIGGRAGRKGGKDGDLHGAHGTMAKQHVIIGGGPAGMHAIESIRKYEPAGRSEIHLISNEPAYSRMVIPYWMSRQIDEAHVLTAENGYYQKMGVTAHVGFTVAK